MNLPFRFDIFIPNWRIDNKTPMYAYTVTDGAKLMKKVVKERELGHFMDFQELRKVIFQMFFSVKNIPEFYWKKRITVMVKK